MPLPNQYAFTTLFYTSSAGRHCELISWWIPQAPVASMDPAYADDLAGVVSAGAGAQLRTCLASDCRYEGVKAILHDSGVTWSGTSTAGSGIGGQAGDSEPDYVCAVIRKFAAVPGRSGYGRWRVGGVAEGDTDDNVLTGAGKTRYLTLGDQLIDPIAVHMDSWQGAHRSVKNDTLNPIVGRDVDLLLGRYSPRQDRFPL